MFGALRVIYDGRIYRSIGGQTAGETDTLEWEGHLTLLVGATPAVDTHFSFEAALGERWLFFRLVETGDERARRRARYTVDRGEITERRQHAQKLAAALIHRARKRVPPHLSDDAKDVIGDVAFFAAHARTGVEFEGTGRYRMPIGYPMPEEPMRLAGQLHRLARCLVALGLAEQLAVRIAAQAALDSVPLARLKALRHVADETPATIASTRRAIGRGNRWSAKWELTALEAIGLIDVEGPDEFEDPNATRIYRLADRYRGVYDSVASFFISLSSIGGEQGSRGGEATKSYTPGAA